MKLRIKYIFLVALYLCVAILVWGIIELRAEISQRKIAYAQGLVEEATSVEIEKPYDFLLSVDRPFRVIAERENDLTVAYRSEGAKIEISGEPMFWEKELPAVTDLSMYSSGWDRSETYRLVIQSLDEQPLTVMLERSASSMHNQAIGWGFVVFICWLALITYTVFATIRFWKIDKQFCSTTARKRTTGISGNS